MPISEGIKGTKAVVSDFVPKVMFLIYHRFLTVIKKDFAGFESNSFCKKRISSLVYLRHPVQTHCINVNFA